MIERGFDVRWTPPCGPTRKIAFEPRSSGGYDRVEYEWSGCGWRQVGEEIVANAELECADGVAIGG